MATERIIDRIERLREKPEHVRNRIALLTAGTATALVALVWMTAMATSGTLALKTDAVADEAADTSSDVKAAFKESSTAFSSLMGAAGAALGATSTEAALKVMESRTTSTFDTKPSGNATDKTVIPF